ncbi:MAG TPA: hypothetical protein VJV78_05535 [Polyangiales bacterium]|nr:hypothetical protein [Polyangiales bacterium]
MRNLPRALIACVFALAACKHAPPPKPIVPPPPPPPPAAPVPPPPPPVPEPVAFDPRQVPLLESGELIAGSVRGLEAWRADGAGQRMISAGAALHPRRLDRDHVLALRPLVGPDLRDGAALDLIALPDGQRRELAQVPAFRCGEPPDPALALPHALYVTDGADFVVRGAEPVACLGMMDASSSMAHVRVRARVDLRTQQVARWLVVGEPDCTAPPGVESGDPSADGVCWDFPAVQSPQLDPSAFPFTFGEEHVRMPAAPRGGGKQRLRGYLLEAPSPSGRWLLLAGDYTQRDYIYRRLLLLDRNDGKLYPISGQAGAWPAPLKVEGKGFTTPVRQAATFANDTEARWLGDSAASELLVLDTLVVRPGERSFDIDQGELCR